MGVKATIYRCPAEPTIDKATVRSWQVMDTPDVPNLSMSLMVKKSSEGHVSRAEKCDLAYMVVSGEGYCLLDGEKHTLKKGDVLYAPKGSEYYLSEGMEIVAACNPRFGA